MAIEVTVLGSSGGYPAAGKACSSFLLSRGRENLVLDLGSGALSNLFKYLAPDEIGGLAITHMHYDHYVDIFGLCTARKFWKTKLKPLPVILPIGGSDALLSVISQNSRESFLECLDIREAGPGEKANIGNFEIFTGAAKHIENSLIFRVRAGGHTVCYSGDTDMTGELEELAHECNLLICEATFTSEVPSRFFGHLFAEEAGRVASKAGVQMLLLTHIWPTLSEVRALEDARKHYHGKVELAREGLKMMI